MGLQPDQGGPSEFARPERAGDLTPFLKLLLRGRTLTFDQSRSAFSELVTGSSHHAEMGAFLALLGQRLPTVDELAGAASVMRDVSEKLPSSIDPARILDTAGTGGAPKTFNVSTLAALIAAAGGVFVAKGGNRSRTGRGSAEILESLGVKVDPGATVERRCLEEAHFAFCFAPAHHPAARHAMPVRKALGFPTIFNLLGPLTNPAGARRHAIGVYDRAMVSLVAHTVRDLGAVRALVYHGLDGLDEMTTGASTLIAEVTRDAQGGSVREYEVTPEELGVLRANPIAVGPADLPEATALFRGVLSGTAPVLPRAMALINASAALVAGGASVSLREGVQRAAQLIDSGAAQATLDTIVRLSNEDQP